MEKDLLNETYEILNGLTYSKLITKTEAQNYMSFMGVNQVIIQNLATDAIGVRVYKIPKEYVIEFLNVRTHQKWKFSTRSVELLDEYLYTLIRI